MHRFFSQPNFTMLVRITLYKLVRSDQTTKSLNERRAATVAGYVHDATNRRSALSPGDDTLGRGDRAIAGRPGRGRFHPHHDLPESGSHDRNAHLREGDDHLSADRRGSALRTVARAS